MLLKGNISATDHRPSLWLLRHRPDQPERLMDAVLDGSQPGEMARMKMPAVGKDRGNF
jgi:hypothetical protein